MPDRKPYLATIKLENLFLDDENPRLPKPVPQDEALLKFAAQTKTLRLAEHLARHGVNPLDIIGVVPSSKRGRYVVKEGNRRVAALRLLNNPHVAGDERLTAKYRKIAKDSVLPTTTDVPCVVFANADEIKEWIVVKHSGELAGAGTVPWDAMEKARFNLRTGNADQYATAYRFLNDAVAQEWITEDEANNVSVSNLTRVLKDTDVQRVFSARQGADGTLAFQLAGDGPRRLARRLAEDWREGGLKVQQIYKKPERREYAEALVTELNLEHATDASPTQDAGSQTRGPSASAARASRTRRSSPDRRRLVPSSFSITIPDDLRRTAFVLKELKALDVHKYPNATACLFRTFIETSVNRYIQKHNVSVNAREDRLFARTEKVIAHMRAARQGTQEVQAAIRPVKAALSKDSSIFSISTLHEYVHNPRWHPEPDDLLKHWDTYGPFLALLWD